MMPLPTSKPLSGLIHLSLIRSAVAATALLLSAAAISSSASAAVILYDDFTAATGQPVGLRPARSPQVDLTEIENNAWNWRNSRAYLATGDGRIISDSTGGSAAGALQIAAPTTGIIETTGVFHINTGLSGSDTDINKTIDWVSVGFLKAPTSAWVNADNLLWALIRPNGQWQIWEGSSTKLSGTVTAFAQGPAVATTISLKFDADEAKATLLINGVDVLGAGNWLSTTFDASSIAATGFNLQARGTSEPWAANITSFEVAWSAIPEPSSAALLSGGAILGFLLVRRRSR